MEKQKTTVRVAGKDYALFDGFAGTSEPGGGVC